MKKLTISDLKEKKLILLECISGSKAYNLATSTSDTDIRGVYFLPKQYYYSLDYQAQISNETNDIVFYEIGRFIELLLKSNPSCLELLATPKEFILYKSPLLNDLNLSDFLTKEVKNTFSGYALSQIKKAKGLNKKFLNPMDKVRKTVIDFCYILEEEKAIPFKTWIDSKPFKQEQLGLSKMQHSKDLFALYYNPKKFYNGIIKSNLNNDMRLSEIPKDEKPIAYLIFQKDEYSTYCKNYKEYWEWMALRNENRYTTNREHGKNYDSKNMMHTIRLLKVVKELLAIGKFNLKRTEDREELLAIKNGRFNYEEIIEMAEKLKIEIESLDITRFIADQINTEKIEQVLIQLRTKLYETHYSK